MCVLHLHWHFIDIFVRVLWWVGGHPMLSIVASVCIFVRASGRAISSTSKSMVFCCILMHVPSFSFNVLHAVGVFGPACGVFLLPGFEVVSSSPQVPRHPTSKCDSDVNCLAH